MKSREWNGATRGVSVEERRCPEAEAWVVPVFHCCRMKRSQQRGFESGHRGRKKSTESRTATCESTTPEEITYSSSLSFSGALK